MGERYVHVGKVRSRSASSGRRDPLGARRVLSRVAACRASRSGGRHATVETAIQEGTVSVGLDPNSFTAIGETIVDSETAQTFAGEGAASDAGYLAERGAVVAPATDGPSSSALGNSSRPTLSEEELNVFLKGIVRTD